jgi:YVTN family beta-propeller protein
MPEMRGRLLLIDTQSMDVATATAIDIGPHPAHVIFSADGARAYVTDASINAVQVIDIRARRVEKEISTGRYPHGLRMSPDGGTIAVANLEDDSISLIDTASSKEMRAAAGNAPVQVAWSPDGRTIFVSMRDEGAVAVIDAESRQRVKVIPVGDGPIQLFATPDGRRVYVANEGTEQQPATTVSVIDTKELRVVRTIDSGRGPHGVVATPDSRRIYVTNRFDDSVSEIDVASGTVTRSYRVGEEPTGVTYASVAP